MVAIKVFFQNKTQLKVFNENKSYKTCTCNIQNQSTVRFENILGSKRERGRPELVEPRSPGQDREGRGRIGGADRRSVRRSAAEVQRHVRSRSHQKEPAAVGHDIRFFFIITS